MKSLLQPYELLGVYSNSTPKEVRKAYYQLALLCHPDKGGDPRDMHIIHCAYEWIMNQLDKVNVDYTYEDAQQEFDDFVAAQNNVNPPSFEEVIATSLGFDMNKLREWYDEHTPVKDNKDHFFWFWQVLWREINLSTLSKDVGERTQEDLDLPTHILHKALDDVNKLYQNGGGIDQMYSASITHGYGDYTTIPEKEPLQRFPGKQVMIYTEQEAFRLSSQNAQSFASINAPSKLDNYSTEGGSVQGFDYSLAYTDQTPNLERELKDICKSFMKSTSLMDRLDQIKNEREMMDQNVATSSQQNRCDVVFGSYNGA